MLELILIVGILVISILLSQVVRWCRNIYFMTCIQNDNIRILPNGYNLLFEDLSKEQKLIRYDQIVSSMQRNSELYQKEIK